MVSKINGGVYADATTSGSLRHFKIETNAAALVDGVGSPDTAIELVFEVLAQRGTPVIYNVATEFVYVAFENTSCSWTAATMETALEALGATVGSDLLDLSACTVTEPGYVLA